MPSESVQNHTTVLTISTESSTQYHKVGVFWLIPPSSLTKYTGTAEFQSEIHFQTHTLFGMFSFNEQHRSPLGSINSCTASLCHKILLHDSKLVHTRQQFWISLTAQRSPKPSAGFFFFFSQAQESPFQTQRGN